MDKQAPIDLDEFLQKENIFEKTSQQDLAEPSDYQQHLLESLKDITRILEAMNSRIVSLEGKIDNLGNKVDYQMNGLLEDTAVTLNTNQWLLSLIHISEPRDRQKSRMPSSA